MKFSINDILKLKDYSDHIIITGIIDNLFTIKWIEQDRVSVVTWTEDELDSVFTLSKETIWNNQLKEIINS